MSESLEDYREYFDRRLAYAHSLRDQIQSLHAEIGGRQSVPRPRATGAGASGTGNGVSRSVSREVHALQRQIQAHNNALDEQNVVLQTVLLASRARARQVDRLAENAARMRTVLPELVASSVARTGGAHGEAARSVRRLPSLQYPVPLQHESMFDRLQSYHSAPAAVEKPWVPETLNLSPFEARTHFIDSHQAALTDSCVICLQTMTIGEQALRLSCLHSFHWDCIRKWFVRQG
eukprot:CAMPEP_0114539084 /NCGR_PEP_ID=MMETSP0114-20121206/50_1 /TAXON_ID=31324 /ORGANISM="Goniomonas sp, Strain m" /LENGTH=233 /DNA_ID=CAMNT_0001723165 /DNA_START=53 /DNA_END=751 /DNA_ORIENTATION=-